MKVLGIDTILHSTCAAVVENGKRVLSNIVEKHKFESRRLYDLTFSHLRCIGEVVKRSLAASHIGSQEIDVVAVNNFGSQISNVLIGVAAAQLFGAFHKIPVIGVPHQEAHYFSCWLERDPKDFNLPIVVLSSSGGHSAIILIKNKDWRFKKLLEIEGLEKIGKTVPNFRGLGAIYGFVAYALGISRTIGGGPLLSKAAESGDPHRFNLFFRRPSKSNILDFTFIERQVKRFLERQRREERFSRKFVADFAASFEYAISEIVLNDLADIAKKYRAREIHLAGGISANRVFRQKLPIFAKRINAVGRVPVKTDYSTDNAAMVASLGYYRYRKSPPAHSKKIRLISNLNLEKMAIEQILSERSIKKFYSL